MKCSNSYGYIIHRKQILQRKTANLTNVNRRSNSTYSKEERQKDKKEKRE